MARIPGGEFLMGSDHYYPEERPARRVKAEGFWIDREPVTNARFREFVEATSYLTFAEIMPNGAVDPRALPQRVYSGSLVFNPPPHRLSLGVPSWWTFLRGANWKHPRGPASTLDGLDNHPVVHVTLGDARAFAVWAGKELPTEAEWERAARGGLDGAVYAWGDDLMPDGRIMANIWHGEFPFENLMPDGFRHTSPVTAFPANGFGLYDMIGNVWEWTTDRFRTRLVDDLPRTCCIPINPGEDRKAAIYDPRQVLTHVPRMVLKGGSYLCAPNSCRRYRPAARHPQPINTSMCNVGFRCIVRDTTLRGSDRR